MSHPEKEKVRKRKSKPTKDLFIDTALELIEEQGGCRGVNLRKIAARAGHAHTCLYNYFDSLESLYWAALDRALESQMADVEKRMDTSLPPGEQLRRFLELQVGYAQEHPAYYSLFWIEPLAGTPPEAILQRVDQMRRLWQQMIVMGMLGRIVPEKMVGAGELVHGYFHGEMCKLVGRKWFITSSPDPKIRIVDNTFRLIEAIAKSGL